ncbi:hypothetical protein LTSEWAN_6437, partial [Salmonella enterica subsp. enterica serovar Wandsworth str. A4-580]
MQRDSGHIVTQHQRLFFVADAYRNRPPIRVVAEG